MATAEPPAAARPASGCVGGSGGGISAASLARYAAARVGTGSDDPRDFMREPDYVATADVEDIYARWDAAVPPDVAEALEPWVLELVAKAPGASPQPPHVDTLACCRLPCAALCFLTRGADALRCCHAQQMSGSCRRA